MSNHQSTVDMIDRCVRLKRKDYQRNRIEPFQQLVVALEQNENPADVRLTTSLIDILQVALTSIDRKTLWKNDEKNHQRITACWICRYFICLTRFQRNHRFESSIRDIFQWLREVKEFHRRDEDLHLIIFQLIEQFTLICSDRNEIVGEFFLVEPEREKRRGFCSRRRAQRRRSICILDYAVDLVMNHEDSTYLINEILQVFLLLSSNVRFTNYLINHTDFYRLRLVPLFTGEQNDLLIRRILDELARSQTDSTEKIFIYTNFLRLIGRFAQRVDLPIISFFPTFKILFDELVECGTTISLFYLIEIFSRLDSTFLLDEFRRIGLTKNLRDFIFKLIQRKYFNSLQIEILILSLRFFRVDRQNLPEDKILVEICQKLLSCESNKIRLLSSLILVEFESNLDDPNVAEQLTKSIREKSEEFSRLILLKSLKKMSFHDENQIEILFEILAKNENENDDDEILEIFEILRSISLDDRWAKFIHSNDKFFALLVRFAETHSNEFIREKSRSILREIRRPTHLPSSHIMFSYNHDSKEIVLKICQSLRQQGFTVWLDVDEMYGDTLETMARAIEQASLVVICLTDKYKQSTNCQSEAEYAYRSNKPIIPLILQTKYKPSGWLGFLLGTKFYVDFTKNDFDFNMDKLVKQIRTMIS